LVFLLTAIVLSVTIYGGWRYHVVNTTCLRIPVKFSPDNTPIIDVVIQGKIYPLGFDLGSKYSLSLDENILRQLNKQDKGPVKWRDFRGDPHETSSYLTPRVDICGFLWTDIIVRETNAQTNTAAYLWRDEQKIKIDEGEIGRIGWPLLERTNLCLNLSQGAIFCCNSL
jgi:hypothetical protein